MSLVQLDPEVKDSLQFCRKWTRSTRRQQHLGCRRRSKNDHLHGGDGP